MELLWLASLLLLPSAHVGHGRGSEDTFIEDRAHVASKAAEADRLYYNNHLYSVLSLLHQDPQSRLLLVYDKARADLRGEGYFARGFARLL